MAGKSNKSRNRGKGSTAISSNVKAVPSPHQVASDLDVSTKSATLAATPLSDLGENGTAASTLGDKSVSLDDVSNPKSDAPTAASNDPSKHVEVTGDLHLYAIPVKTQSGEKLELQLNPADSVMDLRQFLLDAPETCFYTCYDLLLHAKDGSVHQMEDYNEISEVADITSGGCSLEMVAASYNYRSIRSHVRRAKELLSMSTLHSSLSTFLGLQHDARQKKPADAAKNDALELDGLGFMEDISGSLCCLLSPSLSKEAKCVESVIFSSFNPPPSYRRLVGDLLYLDVTTLEGHKYCITGSTRNFYVNASTPSIFDCKPAKPANEATTLIGLLQKISPKFKKGFREILERKASAHPFENVQTPLPANSWLGAYPTPEHVPDASRAEDALVLSFGSELIGMQRDWNEELQSCREFPYKTTQERILRDRALYKVTCDFVDAAVSGAIGVINRCIPPINPTDPECFHMYVHNNIFFSFAVDADLRQMPKSNLVDVKGKIQPDLNFQEGTRSLHKSLDMNAIDGIDSGSEQNLMKCSTILDVPADMSSETQLADSEQATYASANNDLKGTKLYQEADVPGLYNLAMTILDYRGHRVVAQSIIPGILQGDKSDSLLYGSVDSGKKICWNEPFHAKVVEAAKRLHLKEHTVLDGNENIIRLAAPVECKGIVGSDERHYLLDLMRVTPRDANYIGPGYRFCVLRPELITAFCQSKKPKSLLDGNDSTINAGAEANETVVCSNSESAEPVLNDKLAEECSSASLNNSMRCEEILLNPNVFTEFKLAGSQEEIAADEAEVMKASRYLLDIVLPKFVQDLFSLEASPMDGQTLTEALHAHGINVRYIGKIADMTKGLPHLWNLFVSEIVVRSAKHILKEWLRDSQDHELGPAVAHFFNCFLGDVPIATKNSTTNALMRNQKKDQTGHQFSSKLGKSSAKANQGSSLLKTQIASYMDFCSQNLWDDILAFAKYKYEFVLPEHVRKQVKQISTVRNLCQKVGLVISARRYDLESSFPFQTADILDLQPVVKHSVPMCKEAKDLVETGKTKLAEGMLNEAYTLFSEAFSILQQVTGPMHREVANCCKYLAMVLYHAGDMAGAIMQQHKELIINERCLGLDHPDTAHSYGNMALFYHGLNQTELALRHMSQTLLLLGLSCGPDHPDVAATFINVAMMYQDIGKMNIALRYLQEALKKNEFLLGKEHIQTAVCYHALAIAFNCMGAYKLSIQHEKRTYDILVKQLGEDDSRTRDSQTWIKTFKMRDLQLNAQKQKGQAIDATSAQKAIDIIKAHPDLVQAFQAAAGGPAIVGSSANRSLNAALIGENLSRGRGFDERAARAAAEVRRKAAAKGLPVRSHHGASVQPLSPLTQLLNVINTGCTPPSPGEGEQANESEKGINAPTENGVLGNKANKSTAAQEATPVGLGTGLGSLEPKKQKLKNRDGIPK